MELAKRSVCYFALTITKRIILIIQACPKATRFASDLNTGTFKSFWIFQEHHASRNLVNKSIDCKVTSPGPGAPVDI